MEPTPEARPPHQGPSKMPDRAHITLPRWNRLTPIIAGILICSLELRATRAAIIAATHSLRTNRLLLDSFTGIISYCDVLFDIA